MRPSPGFSVNSRANKGVLADDTGKMLYIRQSHIFEYIFLISARCMALDKKTKIWNVCRTSFFVNFQDYFLLFAV